MNKIRLPQDRNLWRILVKTVMNLSLGEFVDWLSDCHILKRNSVSWRKLNKFSAVTIDQIGRCGFFRFRTILITYKCAL